MKLNLIRSAADALVGYTNVCPFESQDEPLVITSEFTDLNIVAEDSQCEEIRVSHILNTIESHKYREAITHWYKKLRIGGRLLIWNTDLYAISHSVYQGHLTIENANKVLFGDPTKVMGNNVSCTSVLELCKLFPSLGAVIITKSIEGYDFYLEVQKLKRSS